MATINGTNNNDELYGTTMPIRSTAAVATTSSKAAVVPTP